MISSRWIVAMASATMVALAGMAMGDDATNTWSLFMPSVKLKLLTEDSLGEVTPGLEFHQSWKTARAAYGNRLTAYLEEELKGTLALDPDLNREPLSASLSGLISFDTRRLIDAADFGFLQTGLQAGYESDQRFENRNARAGLFAGYVNNNKNLLWPLVPNADLHFDAVWNDRAEERAKRGVDDNDSYARWNVNLSWAWFPGTAFEHCATLQPLGLLFDYRYFQEENQETAWKDAHLDCYDYAAAMLSYHTGWKYAQYLFLKYADGHLPTETEDETTLSLGVVVYGEPGQ